MKIKKYKTQLEARGITENTILEAIKNVDREAFVPVELKNIAYEDTNIKIDDLIKAKTENIATIPGLGSTIAEGIKSYFSDPKNLQLIEQLKEKGLHFKNNLKNNKKSNKLNGYHFVVSGKFKNFTRQEIKDNIEQNGGIVTESVSENRNYLLIGKNPGPSKMEKAQKYGIPIIDENTYLKMIA